MELTAKQKALETAVKEITKDFGEGAIMKLGDNSHMQIEVIPTGSLNLDAALGLGGVPRGRVVEIYGAESSGKTTIALHIIAEAQKMGGIAAFIDAEHALDPVYAKALGVDIDELLIAQPDFGEQALDIADTLVWSPRLEPKIRRSPVFAILGKYSWWNSPGMSNQSSGSSFFASRR